MVSNGISVFFLVLLLMLCLILTVMCHKYVWPCKWLLGSWENDIVNEIEHKQTRNKISVSFECELLKADTAAEDHIRKFLPKLVGMDAVGKWFPQLSGHSCVELFINLEYAYMN